MMLLFRITMGDAVFILKCRS